MTAQDNEPKPGDNKKPNLLVKQQFLLKGKPQGVGAIIPKSDFANKSDWLNLLNMPKPRVEETADKVQPAPAAAKKKSDDKMPGA